jgi:hypothetical protein
MVESSLSGNNTQTRRLNGLEKININPDEWTLSATKKEIVRFFHGKENNPNPIKRIFTFYNDAGETVEVSCPFGTQRDNEKKSDILWVRETTCFVMCNHAADLLEGMSSQRVYKASVHPDWMEYAKEKYGYKWTPSIHMPKDYCRLFLRVKNVRIERLQDISENDAKAEGIEKCNESFLAGYKNYEKDSIYDSIDPLWSFKTLWISIYGKQSWDLNPWVWVIEFEKTTRPSDFLNSKLS